MKASYEKPITIVDVIQYQTHLLQASQTKGMFTEEAPTDGWDIGGGNANEYHFNNNLWDEE